MKFRYIFFLLVLGLAFEGRAQLDSVRTLPVPEHSHVLEIDTFPGKNQLQRDFLRLERPQELTGLLNNLTVSPKTFLKSASEYLKLDSIVVSDWQDETQTVENTEKMRFDANADGSEMILRYYSWNTENWRWKTEQANYYFFGTNGRLDSTEYQEYVVGNYKRYIQTQYIYENELLRYTQRRQKIDEIETWEELDRTKYTYDSIGQLTHVYSQKRDPFDDRWATYFYIEYTRDTLGNVVQETGYDYEDYDGISTRKYYLTYDYNDSNRLVIITEFVKGWQEGQFVEDRKQENSYDENGQLKSETYYNWEYDSDGWLEDTRLVYDHTVSGGELQTVVSQDWNGQWLDKRKALYLTNHFYTIDEVLHADFLDAFVPMVVIDSIVCERIEKSILQNNAWTDAGLTAYYFSTDWPTGTNDIETSTVRVYPNPVSDFLNIETGFQDVASCVLYDLAGRVVHQTQITSRLTMDVSRLTSGFYILEVRHDNETVYSGKLIKK
ncbi:T9SS type A sorting domain-containing protein [Maribellus sp. YY47]|uniref:T9SS type A sorting domain-containing protein n=1 Tax=Maribellus sp. YY47 TaxID=2929486 RepID=UPI002000F99C|nr:T9SS type A sorting domain-containing protein [Maribellus sp. YY47]MCK3684757.1 T9SS type A sorting domain-containing protein [Maribellus sp. YY47]